MAAVPCVQEAIGTLDGGSEALFVHPADTIEVHDLVCSVNAGDHLQVGRILRSGDGILPGEPIASGACVTSRV